MELVEGEDLSQRLAAAVPSTMPSWVARAVSVGEFMASALAGAAGSSARDPDRVARFEREAKTLASFRPRWTIRRDAPGRAPPPSESHPRAPGRAAAPLLQPLGERLPLEVLHDEVGGPALLTDVVQAQMWRWSELRDGARLTIDAFAELDRRPAP